MKVDPRLAVVTLSGSELYVVHRVYRTPWVTLSFTVIPKKKKVGQREFPPCSPDSRGQPSAPTNHNDKKPPLVLSLIFMSEIPIFPSHSCFQRLFFFFLSICFFLYFLSSFRYLYTEKKNSNKNVFRIEKKRLLRRLQCLECFSNNNFFFFFPLR